MSITLLIIAASVIFSLMAFNKRELLYRYELNPYSMVHNKQWYRVITHALIHADFMHLFVNMFVLWNFGPTVEKLFIRFFGVKGLLFYVMLYLGGILFSALPSIQKHQNNPSYNAVGASGAVSAILFSSIMFMPMTKLRLLFIPIGIPAWIFGILYLVYEIYSAKNSNDHIAHDAHYVGAIFGVVFTLILEPSLIINFFNQVF
jgi:membrane associated rhomboid family serine protease